MGERTTVLVRGTGSIGLRHVQTLQTLGHRVIAVPVRADRSTELEARGIEVAPTVEAAVGRGATAAVIATDTGRHVEDALEALALGCHVLVEKPLAPTRASIGALGKGSEAAGRRVYVAYCLRFHEGLQLFRQRLKEVGEVHAVRIACQSYLPSWRPDRDYRESYSARADEGGVLRDLSHEVDYALWLFGPASDGFSALLSSTSRLGIEAEESADLSWRTGRGAIVSLRLDYLTLASRRSMLAQGSEGEIEWDAIAGTVRSTIRDAGEQLVTVAHDRDVMMQSQAAAFLAACRGAAPNELCSLEEGTQVVSLCDAAHRVSGRRTPIGEA